MGKIKKVMISREITDFRFDHFLESLWNDTLIALEVILTKSVKKGILGFTCSNTTFCILYIRMMLMLLAACIDFIYGLSFNP